MNQIRANDLDQWLHKSSKSPLVARISVQPVTAFDPAAAKLALRLGIGAKATDLLSYRQGLQEWLGEVAPGWTLVWPEDIWTIVSERAGRGAYAGLSIADLLWIENGFLHPRIHAELTLERRIPLVDPHDLLTHLQDYANAHFRDAMTQRAAFVSKWMLPAYVSMKLNRLINDFPFLPVSKDPFSVSVALVFRHLYTDVRDTTNENLPVFLGEGENVRLAWHGSSAYTLAALLSNTTPSATDVTDVLMDKNRPNLIENFLHYKSFASQHAGTVEMLSRSQQDMCKINSDKEIQKSSINKRVSVIEIVQKILFDIQLIEDRGRATDEFLTRLAIDIGKPPYKSNLGRLFNYDARLEYLETSLTFYEQYLSWLQHILSSTGSAPMPTPENADAF